MRRALLRVVARPFSWSLFALGAAVMHVACGGGAGATSSTPRVPTMAPPGATAVTPGADASAAPAAPRATDDDAAWTAAFDQVSCHGSDLQQCGAHAVDVVDAYGSLVTVEDTRDRRSVPIGIEAIHGDDAELVVEGLRIVGAFPREPGVYEAVLPRLDDPRPVVQRLAASILSDTERGAELARQYQKGHEGSLDGVTPDTHDPVRSPATWGFPVLTHATPYPPGDGPTSLGYATTATVEQVASFYAQQPGAKRMTPTDYEHLRSQAVSAAAQPPEMAELKKLEKQLTQTVQAGHPPDPAVIEKMRELSAKATQRVMTEKDVTPYPGDSVLAAGQFVVLTMDQNVPRRWVAVYQEPAYHRTIAILAWSRAISPAPMPGPIVLHGWD